MSVAGDALDVTKRLVAFDTTSRLSNLQLIEAVAAELTGLGARVRLTHDDSGTKANLFATIGPERDGGVVLSGHSDVVPVDGQDWSSDPFEPVIRDGRLHGRGTADMKSFLGCALALAPRMAEADLTRPIHFAISYDEEVGCIGVRRLIADMEAAGIRPALCIVGEPTSMRVVNAHKGICSLETRVRGREAHSSRTHAGANAVMAAAKLIGFLETLAEELRAVPDPTGRFDPPYTTVQSSFIRGGTAGNIIARDCSFLWEYRLLPDADGNTIRARFEDFAQTQVLPALREVAPEAAIETIVRADAPALAPEPGGAAEALALRLTGRNGAEAVSYGAEAGLFQRAGISTVICGPGDIAQAHAPDEFIALDQIAACTAFLERLIAEASA